MSQFNLKRESGKVAKWQSRIVRLHFPTFPLSYFPTCSLLALLALTSAGFAQGARLTHVPPGSADAGSPIVLTATIEGSDALPTEGRVYYRPQGLDAFTYVEMTVDRYQLSGEIPAAAVGTGEVAYYLWVEISGGAELTLPMGAPTAGDFLRIPIRSPNREVAGAQEAFIILNPEPGSMAPEGELVIAVSILQGVTPPSSPPLAGGEWVDVTAIRLLFDGKDYTSSAKITEDLIVLPLPSARPGPHSIALVRERDGKQEKLLGWSFEGPVPKTFRPKAGPVAADVTTGVSYDDVSDQTRRTAYLDGRISGSYGKLKWAGKGLVTSRESKKLQRQNRFLAALEYNRLALKVGDAQPQFSEFSVWGVRTRGVELNYHGYAFNLDVALGEITRTIEGTSRLDTTFVTDSTGIRIKSRVTPNEDSVIVRNVTDAPGRYRRNLLAIRPGFNSEHSTLSFNILKVKDQVTSIDWGKAPKDNVVLGVDWQLVSAKRRTMFTTETALSLYNSDITDGPMEQAKPVEQFIVVNQFFQPLPTDRDILSDDIEQVDLAKKLVGELAKSSLAHRSTLTLNYFRNELRLGYKTIGASFKSLGSPTIQTDVAGLSVEDRIRLLNSRLYVTVGYESYGDNVNARAKSSTDRQIIRGGISFYSPPSYPNVSLSVRRYDQDGKRLATTMRNGVNVESFTPVDNTQAQYGVGLDQSFRWMGYENFAAVSLSQGTSDDEINPALATEQSALSLALQSRRQPMELRGSLNLTNQSAQNGLSSIDYTSFNVGGRYNLLPNHLWLSSGLGLGMADGAIQGGSGRGKTDFTRLEFDAGAEYQFSPSHQVALNAWLADHTDDSYNEQTNLNGRLVKTYNRDAAGFVNQDDKSVRLTYTFKM